MKIAIVIEKFQPASGGNERSTHQIATRLIERGHEVTVLTNRADRAADLLPGGRIVEAKGWPTKFALGLARFIVWAEGQLRRGDFDVSLSVSTAVAARVIQPRGGTVRETLARNLAMRRSPLKRLTKRLALAASPKQWALLLAERRTLNHADVRKIVAVSAYVADQLFTHYLVRQRRVEVIPNAAEVRRLDGPAEASLRRDTRAALGLADNDIVFLFAAINPGLKGLGYALEALAKLRQAEPRAHLIVAGTLHHGPLERLEKMGLRDAVRWVGPTRRMDALYSAADVTVLPSWYDPSSKVVLESLLHGVPAITTLYNGAAQWIVDPAGEQMPPSPFKPFDPSQFDRTGWTGRVIREPSDVDALAEAMRELCDPAERRRCAAATQGLDQRISMARHVELLERVLIEAAGRRSEATKEPAPSGGG